MQYCSNCGTKLNVEAKFCPECGSGVAQTMSPAGAETKSDAVETVLQNDTPSSGNNEFTAAAEPADTEAAGQADESEAVHELPTEAPASGLEQAEPTAPVSEVSIPASTSTYDQSAAAQSAGSYYQQPTAQSDSSYYQQPAAQSGSSYYQQPAAQNGSSYYQQPAAQSGSSYYQQPAAQSGSSYYQQPAAQSGSSYYQQPAAQSGSSYYQQPAAQSGNAYYQGGASNNQGNPAYAGTPNYQTAPKSSSGSVVAGVLLCIFLPLVGLIYTLIKKPFQKTGQTIAVIWCIVAMVLCILIPVIYYINYYRAMNELYNYSNYEINLDDENVIIDDITTDDNFTVSASPDPNTTYGDIPLQLSIFDSLTSANIVKACDEIGLDIEGISSLIYYTDWEKGPIYTFDYNDATIELYLYEDGKVYSIETGGTQVYLEGYEPWQISDYIGDSTAPAASAPVSAAPAAEMPDNGYIFYENGGSRVCPLTVVTQGDYCYYVKLVDAYNESEVLTFFIRPGQTVDIDVPLGDYFIRYASGLTWYDKASLFGPDTVYSEAGDIFYFTEDESSYYGYTVELYMQEGGNLNTYDIGAGDF